MSEGPDLATIPDDDAGRPEVKNKPPKWLFLLLGGGLVFIVLAIGFVAHLVTHHASMPKLTAPPLPVGAKPASAAATKPANALMPRTFGDDTPAVQPSAASAPQESNAAAPATPVAVSPVAMPTSPVPQASAPVPSSASSAGSNHTEPGLAARMDQLERDMTALKAAPYGQATAGLQKSIDDLRQQMSSMEQRVAAQSNTKSQDEALAALRGTVHALQRQVRSLEALVRTQEHSTHASTDQPPFRLVSTEVWGDTPNAVVNWDGRLAPLQVRDIRAGWVLRDVSMQDQSATFEQIDTGRRVTLRVGG